MRTEMNPNRNMAAEGHALETVKDIEFDESRELVDVSMNLQKLHAFRNERNSD